MPWGASFRYRSRVIAILKQVPEPVNPTRDGAELKIDCGSDSIPAWPPRAPHHRAGPMNKTSQTAITKALGKKLNIPTLPVVVVKIKEMIEDPDCGTNEIG